MELDADSVNRARAGDRAAQQQLVEVYQRRVYALCAALAGSDAEDVAQEALLHALAKLATFDPRGTARLGTFVLRIARNLCIDRARSAHVRLADRAADVDHVAGGGRADIALAHEQSAERVRCAVLALPDDQRAAVALRMWGELDYAEIAAIEHVPIGTIRSRLARAREALRAALAYEEHADVG